MAHPALHLYVLAILLLALSFMATSPSTSTSTSTHNCRGFKCLHFTLYQQEAINKTVYLIVKGVTGPDVSPSASPFGSMFVNHDLLTISPNSSSKVVGVAEGVSITSSLDGLTNVVMEKITLELKHYKGSVSVIGTAHNIKVIDLPVVGGTGDFMFVQGYIKPSLVTFENPNILYKIEFHLYWPSYVANHFSHSTDRSSTLNVV
ncbi:hypothetical protein D5086_010468 [Populus alba]|uniref:Dirigent protein n=3 Tax=Populus TaxID=3689 RepID=A0A4V6XWS4_POPAL|nr:hypothetical protein NC653_013491 [Populus alba x Populus x berolinensis]TKS00366.1 hypothetical protein D5086_0000185790 [Populus alba]